MMSGSSPIEDLQQRLDHLREAIRTDPRASRAWWYLGIKLKVLSFLCSFYQHTRPLPSREDRPSSPPGEPSRFDWLRTPIYLDPRRRASRSRPPSRPRAFRSRVSLARRREPRTAVVLQDLLARIAEANEAAREESLEKDG
jgi:hypothetical protein